MEEVALWVIVSIVTIISALIGGMALYERRHHKRVQALSRRRKERIKL